MTKNASVAWASVQRISRIAILCYLTTLSFSMTQEVADEGLCRPYSAVTIDAGVEGEIKTSEEYRDIYNYTQHIASNRVSYLYCITYLTSIKGGSLIWFTVDDFTTQQNQAASDGCLTYIEVKDEYRFIRKLCPNQHETQHVRHLISTESCSTSTCRMILYFRDDSTDKPGVQLSLSYKVVLLPTPSQMDFRDQTHFRIVSHESFDYGASTPQNITTHAVINTGQTGVGYDITFEYFERREKGYVEFEYVKGFEENKVKIYSRNSSKTLRLYPVQNKVYIGIKCELSSSKGFSLKMTVVQQNSTPGSYGCDTEFITNANVTDTTNLRMYNMTCLSGYQLANSSKTSTQLVCSPDGKWDNFSPCTESATDNQQTTKKILIPTTQQTTTTKTITTTYTTLVTATKMALPSESTTEPGQLHQTTRTVDQMKKGNYIPIVAGLGAAIGLVIIIIPVVVVLLRRRGRNKRHKPGSSTGEMITNNNNEEGEVRIPLTQRRYEEGGNIYEMTDDMPDVVNHTPMLPPANGAASAAQPNVPEDGGELDYENSMTISDKKQDDTITDVYAPILASQKKPKEEVVVMEENDLYGT